MSDDDDFVPKLGKSGGDKDRGKVVRYGGRILAAARLSGHKTGLVARRFDGSRIGRGASIGRLLSSRDRLAGFRGHRAIVKTRLVRLGNKGLPGARAYLRYIQRDGVTREGAPGELYGRDVDQADGKAFLERCDGDRHQFRFIVSAEDGAEYADLKPYIRRLMVQAEHDLGTRLDWVAVDHFNTDNPHSHIMLRGVDDQGDNLVIAREYIAHGFRERAAELATIDLGPRTDREIEARLRYDVEQERLTAIDRRLLGRMDDARVVVAASKDPFQQSVAAGRVKKLEAMGLADDLGGGRWRLAGDLEDTLRRMGERGDVIRTMQRELTVRRLDRIRFERVIEPDLDRPLVGRLIHRGFSDEHRDRHYLMIDGVDGRVHYVDIGHGETAEPLAPEATVRITWRKASIRGVDQTIADIAAANEGRYAMAIHLRSDPSATQTFAESHLRRLEALRRGGVGVERQEDGSWLIAQDHLNRVAAYEARRLRDRPVDVEMLSALPVDTLAKVEAATWLDRDAASGEPLPLRDAGVGAEVRAAVKRRLRWLIEQELADSDQAGGIRLRANALPFLQRRELIAAGEGLTRTLGKMFSETREGERIEGVLSRRIDLLSGRFALIEKNHEFTLVPWKPVLDQHLGKSGSGIMRLDGINWQFGRARSGREIS
jgi:type IV secretory pathway VirD2 relaxase